MCATSYSDPRRNFDGKIRIWHVCEAGETQKTTTRGHSGEEYKVNVTIDSAWYQQRHTDKLLTEVGQNTPWVVLILTQLPPSDARNSRTTRA